MSAMSLPLSTSVVDAVNWRGHAAAAGVAVAVHIVLAAALLGHAYHPSVPTPAIPVITTQLVSVPAPAVAPVLEPSPPPSVIEPPRPSEPVQAPAPVVPSAAELAYKREQQREKLERVAAAKRQREDARKYKEQKRFEQQRLEQARQDQAAREVAEARDAQLRLDAERRAADERARAAAQSQQYLPITKKAPDYPQRALDKGVQGDCTVSYTVDTQGRVRDPKVLDGCHPWFAQASLQAARSFRYQPRSVNGQPIEVPGVRNTFHYSIDRAR